MKTLIYTGGEIKGYQLNIGDPVTFITQREFNEMGISIKLNALWDLKQQNTFYITTNELIDCFEVIS